MPSSKKHRGLGRGLDALIPAASSENETELQNNQQNGNSTVNYDQQDLSGKDLHLQSEEHLKKENTEGILNVRITSVEPDRSQPRKNFDPEKLQELADSIKSKGLLEPILVQDKKDHYEIIAGERRWRACKIAGLKEIPVIVRTYDDLERVEISLIENIQREDLNPIEEAKAYERLINEFHLKQEEVAERVSRDRSSIANAVRLLKLCEPVQDMVAEGKISMGHARALIPIEDPEQQTAIAEKIIAENLSVRETEKLIKNLSRKKPVRERKEDPQMTALYHDIEGKINSSLGMKVTIKTKSKTSGSLQIDFSNQEDLEKLMDRLIIGNAG